MATVDTSVNELVINKLTQAQYDALTEKSPTELYFVTDAQDGNLPDQTGNADKFLMTDGSTASWSDKPLVNTATGTKSISIMTATATGGGAIAIGNNSGNYSTGAQATKTGAIAIGGGSAQGIYCARALGENCIAIGPRSTAGENRKFSAIAIGESSTSTGNQSIAIGLHTNVTGQRSVLIGSNEQGYMHSITENDTMYFQNNNGQFKLLNSDGTIPTDRFTTTPTDVGTYVPKLTIAEDGTTTREWGTELGSAGGSSSQVAELPEATVDNLGTIVQYIGETTADYTNGYFYKSVEDYTAPVYKLASINPHEVQIVDSKAFFKFVEDTIRSQGFDGLPLNIGLHINIMFDPMFAEDGKYPVVIVSDDAMLEFQVFFDKEYLLHDIGLSNNLEDFSEAIDIMVKVTEPSSTTLMWKPVDVQPTLQVVEIPEASKENLGQIIQYVGKTSTDYNNGYFYKSSGLFNLTVESINGTVWDIVEVEVNNLDLFVETFGDMLGTYILRVDPSQSWMIERPGGTMYTATAPIDYGLAITVNGDLQTGMETTAPSSLEIVLEYTSDGFMWKQVNTQPASEGNYLPLSGGTLSGPVIVEMEDNGQTFIGSKTTNGLSIGFRGGTYIETKSASDEVFVRLDITSEGIACLNEQIPLGRSTSPWSNVFTPKLNNGEDIAIPATGGTMVVATPPTDNGTYVLKATVVNGVVTTEWVSEA